MDAHHGASYSEDALVEQPAIALLREFGWETYKGFHEFETPGGRPLGRETKAEVVLVSDVQNLSQLDIDMGGLDDGDSGTT